MALVILGLGNDLLGDDGIGLLAADAMQAFQSPQVTVRSAGQSGLYLLEHLQGYEDAIVVDSVLGDHPGAIRELTGADVSVTIVPSAHYVGLPEALALARSSGLPVPRRLRIFGVEIDAAQQIGSGPSPAVAGCLTRLTEVVANAATEWGYVMSPARRDEVTPDA